MERVTKADSITRQPNSRSRTCGGVTVAKYDEVGAWEKVVSALAGKDWRKIFMMVECLLKCLAVNLYTQTPHTWYLAVHGGMGLWKWRLNGVKMVIMGIHRTLAHPGLSCLKGLSAIECF
jgi:hypothetical protein